MAINSYYSGDLAAINTGRTADAAVQASDANSFRNYLASLSSDRTRQSIADRELSLRGELGRGALANTREATGVTRELGLGNLDQNQRIAEMENATRLEQIQARLEEVRIQGQQMIDYYKAGGSMTPALQIGLMKNQQDQRELMAQAQTAATIANADLATAAKETPVEGWDWWKGKGFWPSAGTDARAEAFSRNTDGARGAIVAGILKNLGPQAASTLEFDPVSKSFGVSRTLFPRLSLAPQGVPSDLPVIPDVSSNRPPPTPTYTNFLQLNKR